MVDVSHPPIPPDQAPDTGERRRDGEALARGGGIVLAAGVADRGIRLATTWFLSGALGVSLFGTYASVVTILLVVSAVAPLGMDVAVVYFGARYRVAGRLDRLKGVLLVGALTAVVTGLTMSLATWWIASWLVPSRPALAAGLTTVAAGVAIWAVLLFAVGILRSLKDMRAQALSFQLVLPAATLFGAVIAVKLGFGVQGALVALVAAGGLAAAVAIAQVWRRVGSLLIDRAVTARVEMGKLFAWSLPQSLESTLFRMHQWTDLLMLTWLATAMDVGLYRVAVSLALLGQLPTMAVVTMFNPMVAELVQGDQRKRLDALLKTLTRWLVAAVVPIFATVALLPDLLLALFDEAYVGGTRPLRVLIAGQAVFVVVAPTLRLIPMSGRAALNLFNHVAVVALNVGLNALLIPRWGVMGAAAATTLTLWTWSLAIGIQARWLVGSFPFDRRSGLLVACGIAVVAGGTQIPADWAALPRIGTVAAALALFAGFFRLCAWTAEDRRLWRELSAPLRRRFGLGRPT